MDAKNEYSEAYFSHGLAVQTAEAATDLLFDQIRRELGLAESRGWPAGVILLSAVAIDGAQAARSARERSL
jgi:hypothetical protein